MNLDLEIAFINKYVVKNKRQRYISFLEMPKKRRTFLEMLYHGKDLDKGKFKRSDESITTTILTIVARLPSNSRCYVISIDKALDGQDFHVASALDKLHAYTEATVLIFGNCDAVYYAGEQPKNEYISV